MLRNEENRFDVYRAMEQFFAQHPGGRIEDGYDVLQGWIEQEACQARYVGC